MSHALNVPLTAQIPGMVTLSVRKVDFSCLDIAHSYLVTRGLAGVAVRYMQNYREISPGVDAYGDICLVFLSNAPTMISSRLGYDDAVTLTTRSISPLKATFKVSES